MILMEVTGSKGSQGSKGSKGLSNVLINASVCISFE